MNTSRRALWVAALIAALHSGCVCGPAGPVDGGSGGGSGGNGGGGGSGGGTGGGGASCPSQPQCFEHGVWKIDNLSPCFFSGADGGVIGATSTAVSGGLAMCPATYLTKPTDPWSTDSLVTACTGHFRLCLALKAGDSKNPQTSDCLVAQPCAEGDLTAANTTQTWPPLEGWTADDAGIVCAQSFLDNGGYAELSVSGTPTGCSALSRVLSRIAYCPLSCLQGPDAGNCNSCVSSNDGGF